MLYVIESVIYDDFGAPQESTPLNMTPSRQSADEQVWMENATSNGDSSIETVRRAV